MERRGCWEREKKEMLVDKRQVEQRKQVGLCVIGVVVQLLPLSRT